MTLKGKKISWNHLFQMIFPIIITNLGAKLMHQQNLEIMKLRKNFKDGVHQRDTISPKFLSLF